MEWVKDKAVASCKHNSHLTYNRKAPSCSDSCVHPTLHKCTALCTELSCMLRAVSTPISSPGTVPRQPGDGDEGLEDRADPLWLWEPSPFACPHRWGGRGQAHEPTVQSHHVDTILTGETLQVQGLRARREFHHGLLHEKLSPGSCP